MVAALVDHAAQQAGMHHDEPAAVPGGGDRPLVVLVGPTGSGKTSLAVRLAERLAGEILSCDSVAVYRGMEIGTAKPTAEERALVPHHLLDLVDPDEPFTAGDWSRLAREALAGVTARGRLPIIAGGTGLYLRALLDGLFPAPAVDAALRERLRGLAARRGPAALARLLGRLDPQAAAGIHANDVSKVVRAVEVSWAARRPLTEQWTAGRDALMGYRVLRLGLASPRQRLYDRINRRAAAMFDRGLVAETSLLAERYGYDCRPLGSLGYAEAVGVLRGELTLDEAVARAQQGHRNYAKRQGTWFRKDAAIEWMEGFGDEPEILEEALERIRAHLVG